jgi:lysophospholipase L1-like esterase
VEPSVTPAAPKVVRGPAPATFANVKSAPLPSATIARLTSVTKIYEAEEGASVKALDRGHTRHITVILAIALAFAVFAAPPTAVAQERDRDQHWLGTWSASPVAGGTVFNNQTLRLIVHTSVGGNEVRVRLSNTFGTGSLVIGAVHVAIRTTDAAIVPVSDRALTFGGALSITIPPGALVVSDPVDLDVPPVQDLAVSIYLPGNTGPATRHPSALQTSYISPAGDFSGAITMPFTETTQSWFFLTDVEVTASRHTGAIVAFGDSITDGTGSTPDTNNRWPNHLANRLLAGNGDHRMAVLDEGIAFNRILHDGPFVNGPAGVSASARFDHDVLTQTGVTHVIMLEGINDIGFPGGVAPSAEAVTADEIIVGLRQLIERAHARGLKIFGGTLTPFEGVTIPGYFTAENEAKRQVVNQWIRTSHAFDAVIDFDAVVRDPNHPTRFLTIYDSGDHLHPSDAGYKAMANTIDLSLFQHEDDD